MAAGRFARRAAMAALFAMLPVGAGSPFAPAEASAATVNVGSVFLLSDTAGQTVVFRTDGTEQVTGFNLRAQIGDGIGGVEEPVFEAVDWTGGIWDAHPATTGGGPVAGAEQFAQAYVVFDQAGEEVAADGVLVALTFDATGFGSGQQFDLRFAGTAIGQDSDFVLSGGTLAPTILNGTLYVVDAPPTPGDATLDGLVNVNDLSSLADNWQREDTAQWPDGDFNGDWNVDIQDLSLMAAHWSGTPGGSVNVPEPAGPAVLGVGAVLAAGRRRRRPAPREA